VSITFNADEIYEMAEQIERNGAKFYEQAAAKAPDDKTRNMLLDMAGMEWGHLEIFSEMRKGLSEEEKSANIFDPDNEAALYLRTMADGKGFEGKISRYEKLTGKETIQDILKIAINAEKNSIAFYTGIEELVSEKAGKDKVRAVIREELGHLTTLSLTLAASQ
jgi:rubrerythrin